LCCFFQAEDGIRDFHVTGVQTCALPISAIRRGNACDRLAHGGATMNEIGPRDERLGPGAWAALSALPVATTAFALVLGHAAGPRSEGRREGNVNMYICSTALAVLMNRSL